MKPATDKSVIDLMVRARDLRNETLRRGAAASLCAFGRFVRDTVHTIVIRQGTRFERG